MVGNDPQSNVDVKVISLCLVLVMLRYLPNNPLLACVCPFIGALTAGMMIAGWFYACNAVILELYYTGLSIEHVFSDFQPQSASLISLHIFVLFCLSFAKQIYLT